MEKLKKVKKHSPEGDILAWFEREVKKEQFDKSKVVSDLVKQLSVEQAEDLENKLREKAGRLDATISFLSHGHTASAARMRKEYEVTIDLAGQVNKYR